MEVTVLKSTRIPLVFLLLLLGSGCSMLPRRFPENTVAAPTALVPNATLDEIISVVNRNSARVQQLQVNNATLTAPGLPSLKTFVVVERPRRIRLMAESFAGQELDLGSNDERYWIWIRRDERRAVYYGQHESFYESAARQILPVPPTWFVEAVGIVEFDPLGHHEGPRVVAPGRLEIRSTIPTPTGELIRIAHIDDTRGWVLRQEVYDRGSNQLLASATADDFTYYPEYAVSLPRSVQIHLPPTNHQFMLRMDNHIINQNYVDPIQIWTMPQPEGAELIDVNRLSSPPPNYVESRYRSPTRRPILRQTRRHAIRRLPLLSGQF